MKRSELFFSILLLPFDALAVVLAALAAFPSLSNNLDGSPIFAAVSYTNFGQVDTQGVDVSLNHFIGGEVAKLGKIYPSGKKGGEVTAELYDDIRKRANIHLFTGAEFTFRGADFHLGLGYSFGSQENTEALLFGDEQRSAEQGSQVRERGVDYRAVTGMFGIAFTIR